VLLALLWAWGFIAVSVDGFMSPEAAQSFPLVELRQYTVQPGRRDALIELFEREFVESQDALGMKILGTFRDHDRPDRFVWIRGFRDYSSRAEQLAAFYTGPVWRAHREAANATIIDSDDVLLLRAARDGSELRPSDGPRPPAGAGEAPRGLVVASLYFLPEPPGTEFPDFFARVVEPRLASAGVKVLASYVTEARPNNFPRLPVRENEHAFVWLAAFADAAGYDRSLGRLARSEAWRSAEEALRRRLARPPEALRLVPTARSGLRP
jgi:hypothetical protein